MSFIILLITIILITLTLSVYRKIYSVALALLIILGSTGAVLFYGMKTFNSGQAITFFDMDVPAKGFYHVVALWFLLDIFCSIKIVRNYIEYRKINFK